MENTKPVEILNKEERLPKYEPPKVITLNTDEILEELGPARACYNYVTGSVTCNHS